MQEYQSEDIAFASRVMNQFIQCVDDGDVRRELAEDCILSVFGRIIKGADAVSGYMRTQITRRFKHAGFQDALFCDNAQKTYLMDRYGRSSEALRGRLKAQSEHVKNSLRLRAGSDEELNIDNEDSKTLMVTPPRPTTPVQHTCDITYIKATGSFESCCDSTDGGLNISEETQLRVTLGYRLSNLLYKGEHIFEIILVIYEKGSLLVTAKKSGQRQSRMLKSSHNAHTDDEFEEPALLCVRRTLFTNIDCEDSEDFKVCTILGDNVSSIPTMTPRKRQHTKELNTSSKRLSKMGSIRF